MSESSNSSSEKGRDNIGVKLFTIKETSNILAETNHTVRHWMKELKDHIPLTKNESGYNVFNAEALERMKLIKQMKRDQNYTLKQIDHYFATGGEAYTPTPKKGTDELLSDELRSIKEELQHLREDNAKQEAFNQSLVDALKQQQEYIDNRMQERDIKLMESLKESQETRKQIATAEEKKGWFDRLFGR